MTRRQSRVWAPSNTEDTDFSRPIWIYLRSSDVLELLRVSVTLRLVWLRASGLLPFAHSESLRFDLKEPIS